MLARQRAPELHDKFRYVMSDRLHPFDAIGGFEVDDGPNVETANRGVGVHASRRPVLPHDLEEPGDVVAKALGRHRGVLDERQRLFVRLHRHRQAERGFTQRPDPCLGVGLDGPVKVRAEPTGLQVTLERCKPWRKVPGVVRIELNTEERRRVALDEALPQRVELRTPFGVVEDEAIHDFDRGRFVREDERRGPERFEKIVELHREHGFGLRQRYEVEPCLEHDAERSLGPHEEFRQVERLVRKEGIQVVAADPTQDLRKTARDLAGMVRSQTPDRAAAL